MSAAWKARRLSSSSTVTQSRCCWKVLRSLSAEEDDCTQAMNLVIGACVAVLRWARMPDNTAVPIFPGEFSCISCNWLIGPTSADDCEREALMNFI